MRHPPPHVPGRGRPPFANLLIHVFVGGEVTTGTGVFSEGRSAFAHAIAPSLVRLATLPIRDVISPLLTSLVRIAEVLENPRWIARSAERSLALIAGGSLARCAIARGRSRIAIDRKLP
jgi:hypothetical protein